MRQKQVPVIEGDERKALHTSDTRRAGPKKPFTCHFCHKPGHFKRDCRKWAQAQKKKKETRISTKTKQSANAADAKSTVYSDSDGESMLVATQALSSVSRGKWIVDSGATCHMCSDKEQFSDLTQLRETQEF